MKTYDGVATKSYPIYDTVSQNAKMGVQVGEVPLVDSTSPLAGGLKVQTDDGVKFAAKDSVTLSNPVSSGNGYFYGYTYKYSTNYAYQYYKYICIYNEHISRFSFFSIVCCNFGFQPFHTYWECHILVYSALHKA